MTTEEDAMAVDGAWNIKFSTPMGERQVTVTLAADGGALSGNFEGPQGSAALEGGTVEGDTVAWNVTIDAPMGEVKLGFEGVVDGDSLNGKVNTPMGPNDFTGSRA
ncbi:MAG TPA: hypothetical protein QGI71_04890 [Dehalococcoidia bacterium]|jgi:hypothetical protein|nr:hypothetical protein [Dehalococcoidia bacterium]